ncbi:hypothetical protein BDV59DRAFT_44044 [Aspergillus ambiguus]|uniref:uncharacterized protein n=1 Tax=Aspergillus ambiguus TaxID=176160 RepID=UPI003CCE4876
MSQGDQNRRPRRLSITQHLQRIFHADKTKDTETAQTPTGRDLSAPPQSSVGSAEHTILDGTKHGLSYASSLGHIPTPHGSTASKISDHVHPDDNSKPSTGQSTPQTPRLRLDTPPATAESPSRPEICVSPTWQKSTVRQSERRATRRLEAERQELEKRLLRLERAEMSDSSMTAKRQSRRLTKKQPLETSSRASSVGADESRTSRLSSVFSRRSSRSRSRSRSGSVNEDKRFSRWSIDRVDPSKQDRTSQTTAPTLSVTLPERLGNVITKELAAFPNISPQHPHPESTSPEVYENMYGDNDTSQQNSMEVYFHDFDHVDLDVQDANNQPVQKDLDRTSFAATLNLEKRSMDVKRRYTAPPATVMVAKSPSSLQNVPHLQSPYANPPPGHLNSQDLTRNLGQRKQKRFTSSPLASPATFSDDVGRSSDTKNTKHARSSSLGGKEALLGRRTPHALQPHRPPNGDRGENRKATNMYSERHRISADFTARGKQTNMDSRATSAVSTPNQLTPPLTPNHDLEQTVQPPIKPPNSQSRGLSSGVSPTLMGRRSRGTKTGKDPTLKELIAIMGDARFDGNDRSRSTENSTGNPMNPHGRGPSNISLSTRSSRESVDYNTADEAPSGTPQLESVDSAPRQHAMPGSLHNPGTSDHTAIKVPTKNMRIKPSRDFRQLQQGQLVAKLFVICCHCQLWHDMPSEIYARLAFPSGVPSIYVEDETSVAGARVGASNARAILEPNSDKRRPFTKKQNAEQIIPAQDSILPSLSTRCCWCEHEMTKECCQGWTTVAQMRERHH